MKTSRKNSIITAYALSKMCQLALFDLEKTNSKEPDRIEKKFQEHLANVFKMKRRKFEDEVKLEEVGGKSVDPTRASGLIDFIMGKKAGIEIKVLALPKYRERRKESVSMWDLGQVTMDAIRLKNAKELKSRFLVWVIKGPELQFYKSNADLRRHIHNRLFIDFVNSSKPGAPLHALGDGNKKFLAQYRLQRAEVRKLGLDTTYETSSVLSRASINFSENYAVIVLEI